MALVTKAGIFPGGFEGCVAYDPTLPLRVAECVMMYGSKDKARFGIEEAVIISAKKPHVLYKDRQQITEFAERMHHLGGANPLPIKLVQVTQKKKILGVWETDTEEWLPRAFMPSALGAYEKVKRHSLKLASK